MRTTSPCGAASGGVGVARAHLDPKVGGPVDRAPGEECAEHARVDRAQDKVSTPSACCGPHIPARSAGAGAGRAGLGESTGHRGDRQAMLYR